MSILQGALAGIGWSLYGWQKNNIKGNKKKTLNYKLLVKNIIIGAAVGVIVTWQGLSFNEAYTWFVAVGGTVIVDDILKRIWKYLR